jgi:hypothetical protein
VKALHYNVLDFLAQVVKLQGKREDIRKELQVNNSTDKISDGRKNVLKS